VLLALAGVGCLLLVVPLLGLFARTPWGSFLTIATDDATRTAIRVSLTVSVLAATLCLALGLPLAWVLARVAIPARGVVRALVLLPMVLPPVVGGTALLFALGRRGLVGQWLDRWFGVTLPFTTAGAVLAATFVALPFFVVAVESALHQVGPQAEEVAASLGAGPLRRFLHVTVPSVRSAVVAGLAMSWARALGEFGATITFAGDSPGRTRTLPLTIFTALETDPNRALVLGVVLVAVSLAVLIALRRHLGPLR
jgi:molybdate transport system permease protein